MALLIAAHIELITKRMVMCTVVDLSIPSCISVYSCFTRVEVLLLSVCTQRLAMLFGDVHLGLW